MDNRGEGCLIIIVFMLFFSLICLGPGVRFYLDSEITKEEYVEVKTIRDKYPDLLSQINEAFKDDGISRKEFGKIKYEAECLERRSVLR